MSLTQSLQYLGYSSFFFGLFLFNAGSAGHDPFYLHTKPGLGAAAHGYERVRRLFTERSGNGGCNSKLGAPNIGASIQVPVVQAPLSTASNSSSAVPSPSQSHRVQSQHQAMSAINLKAGAVVVPSISTVSQHGNLTTGMFSSGFFLYFIFSQCFSLV